MLDSIDPTGRRVVHKTYPGGLSGAQGTIKVVSSSGDSYMILFDNDPFSLAIPKDDVEFLD